MSAERFCRVYDEVRAFDPSGMNRCRWVCTVSCRLVGCACSWGV